MTMLSSSPALEALGDRTSRSALGTFERVRLRILARWTRCSRWEFWPAWVLYSLLIPHFIRLAIRHRSLTVFTAANPAIPLGGLVGESKWDILSRLPASAIVPTAVIEPDEPQCRAAQLALLMRSRGWHFPIILKPDVGERGSGVRLIRNHRAALEYFVRHADRVLAQAFHPGPFEVGVFYVRSPLKQRGRIFSITDKRAPQAVGDGKSTLEALIWRHPRLRLQAGVFLDRLGDVRTTIPAPGERITLAVAGNHCQGTMFLDGQHLATPALARAIDTIASSSPGLFFGRFDIRYETPEDFAAGRGFRIIELNGVLSESTNIYDPSFSLMQGLRVLARQWSLAFQIGSENRAEGARQATLREVLHQVRIHSSRSFDQKSD